MPTRSDYRVADTWERPAEKPFSLPGSADVVIIGGGIIGVATAWFLARQGVQVVLCEKGRIAGEQSSRNWGWVRQQGRDPRELPMMIESLRLWHNLEDQIGEEVGFTECGCLFLARDDAHLESMAAWLPIANEHGLDTRIVEGSELDSQLTFGSGQWRGGLFTASDARAEPHKAVPAMARAVARDGVPILTNCAVRGIETSGGRVSGVVTEHGTISTSTVLCAAGAWTSMFCRTLGISVPQLKVRGTVARTAPAPKLFNGCVFDERVGMRRRQDGGYTVAHGAVLDHSITPSTLRYARKFLPALKQEFKVLRLSVGKEFWNELTTPTRWDLDKPSPFEQLRVLNPDANPKVLRQIKTNLAEAFPALADTAIVESWAGIVETTPDVLPIIDAHDELEGFHIATGLSGHGFGIGLGAGKVIAALLTGQDCGMDMSVFRLQRFFDGSPIEPMHSV